MPLERKRPFDTNNNKSLLNLSTLVIFKVGVAFLIFCFVISLGYLALQVKKWSLCIYSLS